MNFNHLFCLHHLLEHVLHPCLLLHTLLASALPPRLLIQLFLLKLHHVLSLLQRSPLMDILGALSLTQWNLSTLNFLLLVIMFLSEADSWSFRVMLYVDWSKIGFALCSTQIFRSFNWVASWPLDIFRFAAVSVGFFIGLRKYFELKVFLRFLLVLVERQNRHTFLISIEHLFLGVFIFLFALFDALLLKIVVWKLNIFDNFIDRPTGFLPLREGLIPFLITHLPPDKFVLKIPNFLLIILNYAVDVLLKKAGKFLMVLVVLAQQGDFIRKLTFLIHSFEILTLIPKGNIVLQFINGRIMVCPVHKSDGISAVEVVLVIDDWYQVGEWGDEGHRLWNDRY